MTSKNTAPTWCDVKGKLGDFDRASLIGLVRDLYAASKDNQAFPHARFGLGADVLKPYKATIDRWLWPDVFKNQDTSVAKAKKAVGPLPEERRRDLWVRLDAVRRLGRNLGYGVGDDMDDLLAASGFDGGPR